jgi:hypothetical protein
MAGFGGEGKLDVWWGGGGGELIEKVHLFMGIFFDGYTKWSICYWEEEWINWNEGES